MHLDHVTLVSHDVETLRAFLVDIAGMEAGPRPPFQVAGYWLYLDGRPAIHLVQAQAERATAPPVPRIDHVAFRVGNSEAWTALIGRLRERRIPFQSADVPLTGESQVFVQLSPAIAIEFVTASRVA